MIYVLMGFVFLYFILIMPKILKRPYFKLFEDRYYAHRGLHDNLAPENSLEAFKLAVEKQYGIEFDVQLSKDEVPVVFHDFSLKRMCGIEKQVNELTFEELRSLRLNNSDEKIPHLNEVLELINGQVPLIVELKLSSNNTKVCEIVAPILDNYNGVYCIESFNPIAVNWYRKNRPNVIRGQLSSNFLKAGKKKNRVLNFLLQNLMFNFIAKPNFIAFNHKYRNMLSFKINHFIYKIPTIAYTIQSKEELEKARSSFDLFIFENFIP